MRVAIVHDWLVTWRGGEKVLEAVASLYPDAPIYTLFCDPSILPASLRSRKIITHPVANRLRFLRKLLLPLLPSWIESFDFSEFDLLISTSSCVAKGVIPNPDAKHLCYVHSPMRYIWDQRFEYLHTARSIPIINLLSQIILTLLRIWDVTSATRVSLFIANSKFVAERIKKYYGRIALVIPPPIDVDRFIPAGTIQKKDYFLAAGAFVGYKRFDLAIAACERLRMKLVIAGSGPDEPHLRKIGGTMTSFVIAPDDATFSKLMQEARGFIFPGIEDFGMTAVEAMAAGTPVIARQAGGALDFIEDGISGIFFKEPSVDSLCQAISKFETITWKTDELTLFAKKFSRQSFLAKLRVTLDELNEPELN